ncbi:uncharacterized protein I303_108289 [Kwoniella dejecticola CBS 10117]|uniref:HD/PDEase domain-containing protein n=1 Tax=Kwoniella dejecticola CBS 10117 TaxID=1296121 RepID=A0A1A5ZXT9_9TREE|nr:uncharacterized protein I303_07384 [Kwoniella dejecticola CBS 10117]OBR82622.1 hypothetical protein I303_07384 [Kwoniella dejecticola CBS 10117]
MSDPITLYGLTAVPADSTKLSPATTSPQPVSLDSLLPLPSTPLASRVHQYVQSELSPDTYRHSIRVYLYGKAIFRECFPQYGLGSDGGGELDESWFLTALLHDIGTTDKNIKSTRLSYEFWAGYHALDLLQNSTSTSSTSPSVRTGEGYSTQTQSDIACKDQAESIAEAIIRHQDIQDTGNITLLTRLIHLGTLLDNIGKGSELIHGDTIKEIIKAYPRPGWSGCFATTVKKEKELKPYTMVSRIDGFEELIMKNGRDGVTGKYDTIEG